MFAAVIMMDKGVGRVGPLFKEDLPPLLKYKLFRLLSKPASRSAPGDADMCTGRGVGATIR